MKVNYEFMFIVSPDTTEEDRVAVSTYVENALKLAEAEDVVQEKMGEKKLAYPIDKKNTGFYFLFKFKAVGEKLIDVEKKININEKVIRYIIVKTGK